MTEVQATSSPGGSVRRVLTVDDYVRGVLEKDRSILGRAITLVESRNPEHNALAEAKAFNIPVIALCGSDCDISQIDYPIVANDATLSSVNYIVEQIVAAYK